MLRNTVILDPLSKPRAAQNETKTRDFCDDACGIAQNLTLLYCFIHLNTRKIPFNAHVFILRSKVELNWTRAIRPVIAQSVQFSKIAKKLNKDL